MYRSYLYPHNPILALFRKKGRIFLFAGIKQNRGCPRFYVFIDVGATHFYDRLHGAHLPDDFRYLT